jgi:4-alpha-glucanotransferase
MQDQAIRDLANDCGLVVDWIDAADQRRQVSVASLSRILDGLGLPCATPGQLKESKQRLKEWQTGRPLLTTTVGLWTRLPSLAEETNAELVLEQGVVRPIKLAARRDGAISIPPIREPGYHRLRYADHQVTLAVAPARCVTIADISPERRLWGLAVQLYSLRRRDDGGIGDTAALCALADSAAQYGADALALSPTHSLFPADPSRYSPYAPSSRLFLNPLLADPAQVFGRERVAAAGGIQARDDDGELIDWPRAARSKYALLKRLFDDFARHDLPAYTKLASDFRRFVQEGGAALDEHARFEARQMGTPVPYHLFLQWIAFTAFAAAQAHVRRVGMKIGLVSDLAIGVDAGGSQVAARPDDFLAGLTIGAPPDFFNPRGQDWGLTSFSPHAMIAGGFEPFLATVRAAMRHASGVRIDHAMGLMRLWLVPQGAPPTEGAYLTYPFDDLLRLLTLESHRHNAVVIGEDLGTVPPEFRHRCREAGIAGMDVLWFQREREEFLPPDRWRPEAVGMTSTHDLPTVAGWWRGADLEQRKALDMVHDDEIRRRPAERQALWRAFEEAGVVQETMPGTANTEPVVDAACCFVAEAPGPLTLLPLEDVMGLTEQPNLPGTVDGHPNWRRRFRQPVAELLEAPAVAQRLRSVNERRR